MADTSAHVQEAISGPVLVGLSFEDADELVRTADCTIDGLGAAGRPNHATHSLLVQLAVWVSLDLR